MGRDVAGGGGEGGGGRGERGTEKPGAKLARVSPRCVATRVFSPRVSLKLQALVYDILPSTTAVFSYAIGSRQLSSNEHFLFFVCWCSNSSKFVTNNSDKTRRVIYYYLPTKFTPAQTKPQSFESRRNSFLCPGWMRLVFTCVLSLIHI